MPRERVVAKSAKEARQCGARFYHGKPCRHCGGTVRYTSTMMCPRCHNSTENAAIKRVRALAAPALIQERNGRCDACGDSVGDRACVDHCHESGRIRGLLCDPCNKTLGFSRESTDRLRGLALYLESAA